MEENNIFPDLNCVSRFSQFLFHLTDDYINPAHAEASGFYAEKKSVFVKNIQKHYISVYFSAYSCWNTQDL